MLEFEILKREGLARVGVMKTPHGEIKTPAFVGAATRATVKALSFEQMRTLGSQAVLANTYHLFLRPGAEVVREGGGLAEFMGWHGPTFTDSGGFQIFSLPKVKLSEEGACFRSHVDGAKFVMTPELSMQTQWEIGADIHMAFDQLAKSEDYEEMQGAMGRTHRWLERCVSEHEKLCEEYLLRGLPEQYLYAVVQGGKFLDLREESAKFCAGEPVDGFGIGGVFTAEGMGEMLSTVCPILPEEKPRHLLGMGQEPVDLFVGAEFGCDTFDCVGPTRMARNGALYTLDGRMNIKNAKFEHDFSPVMEGCECECCKNYTRAYLHHLFRVDEIMAKVLASVHNEYFVVATVEKIRESLLDGSFADYKREFLGRYYS
ncbi:tRNA guanosine(34) transglycosylase Tgt [Candidatus Saccharibacteria bacterium]|nr:tRNA guanosine(34) transglycosylase Tgt [Candidatus Saccharibacteria bacterium]